MKYVTYLFHWGPVETRPPYKLQNSVVSSLLTHAFTWNEN